MVLRSRMLVSILLVVTLEAPKAKLVVTVGIKPAVSAQKSVTLLANAPTNLRRRAIIVERQGKYLLI